MKSLVLKDLYNIGHNAKSMLFILIVFAAFFLSSGPSAYIYISTLMCVMMIVTTFAFDDNSKWERYAMVMPISKRDLVAGKFITLIVFCLIGSLFGLVVGTIGGVAIKQVTLNFQGIVELLLMTLIACSIGILFGSILIPLLFKFGAEKGRMLMMVSLMIPAAICAGIYQILKAMGIVVSEQFILIMIVCSPFIALVWSYLMYRTSCKIFESKEL